MSTGGWSDNSDAQDRLARLTAEADAGRPAAAADRPARRSAGRVARTLRTRWWPRFLVAGVLLLVLGGALLSGVAQALVAGSGAAIIVALMVRTGSWSNDSRHEPPMPPGAPPPGGGSFA